MYFINTVSHTYIYTAKNLAGIHAGLTVRMHSLLHQTCMPTNTLLHYHILRDTPDQNRRLKRKSVAKKDVETNYAFVKRQQPNFGIVETSLSTRFRNNLLTSTVVKGRTVTN